MVQLTLPPGSKVRPGRVWSDPAGAGSLEVRVYRWSPESDEGPRLDTYRLARSGPMVLDALHRIRSEIDPTLSFRRSCREGICGSCSMNINGVNALACMTPVEERLTLYPLPHMRIIRDLVPDLSRFFQHYDAVRPYLEADPPPDGAEHRQSPRERERLDGLYECILCACCSSACPSYWWNEETFPGPAALLQAHRWVMDSRDADTEARVERTERPQGIYGCRQILNCAKACPKGLNPAKAIAELRLLAAGEGGS